MDRGASVHYLVHTVEWGKWSQSRDLLGVVVPVALSVPVSASLVLGIKFLHCIDCDFVCWRDCWNLFVYGSIVDMKRRSIVNLKPVESRADTKSLMRSLRMQKEERLVWLGRLSFSNVFTR